MKVETLTEQDKFELLSKIEPQMKDYCRFILNTSDKVITPKAKLSLVLNRTHLFKVIERSLDNHLRKLKRPTDINIINAKLSLHNIKTVVGKMEKHKVKLDLPLDFLDLVQADRRYSESIFFDFYRSL